MYREYYLAVFGPAYKLRRQADLGEKLPQGSRFKLFKNSIPCSAYRMEIAVSLGLAFMETEK
jgi:hypothetical protein